MKVTNIIKGLIFSAIFFFLLNFIYNIFSWKDTAGAYCSSTETFYELEENIVDVLFLGSSHCYCSVNPSQLWEEYGMASFSMAISGQDLASSYYCMKEALKTQDLKVVCVDLYGCTFQGYAIEGNLYRNTLSRKLSKDSVEAVSNMVETGDKSDFVLKWPIIHTRYKELAREDFAEKLPPYLGYSAGFNTLPVTKQNFAKVEAKPFGEAEQDWIRKIIELAKGKNVSLVFFLAPYQMSLTAQEHLAYAKQMIGEYGVPIIDLVELSDAIGLDWEQDFVDSGHTNHYGATKVTKYLGEYLKTNYVLEDFRGDEAYVLWDEDLKARKHEVKNHELLQKADMKTYFEMLSTLEDYTVVISSTGEYLSGEANIDEYLQMVGSFHEFYDGSAVWILNNKETTQVIRDREYLDVQPLTYGELLISCSNGQTTVFVDRAAYKKTENGVNVMVYDNILGKVVDSVGFEAMYAYGMVR